MTFQGAGKSKYSVPQNYQYLLFMHCSYQVHEAGLLSANNMDIGTPISANVNIACMPKNDSVT